jgi:predicted nucleic acid-binding protein
VKRAVVDASVAVKWVVPEEHTDAALRLLTNGVELEAPGHWLAEVSTTLWAKSAIWNVLTRQQAEARIEWLCDLGIKETPIRGLLPAATRVAFDFHLTVYDTLYLVLAESLGVPLVTADRKLHDKALADSRFAKVAVWVEQVPE